MTNNIILFIHVISATAWVGGGLLLFGMGIYFKDPKVQNLIYSHIGPFYGYFQLIWITLLIITGLLLLNQHNLYSIILNKEFVNTQFGILLYKKLLIVLLVVIATVIHMYVSLKANGRQRTNKEKIISRTSSLLIFLLNFFIIWYAIQISKFFT